MSIPTDRRTAFAIFHAAGDAIGEAAGFAAFAASDSIGIFDEGSERPAFTAGSAQFQRMRRFFGMKRRHTPDQRVKDGEFQLIGGGDCVQRIGRKNAAAQLLDVFEQHDENLLVIGGSLKVVLLDQFVQLDLFQENMLLYAQRIARVLLYSLYTTIRRS